MKAQVKANITTIRKIGEAVRDYSDELPFDVACLVSWCSWTAPLAHVHEVGMTSFISE